MAEHRLVREAVDDGTVKYLNEPIVKPRNQFLQLPELLPLDRQTAHLASLRSLKSCSAIARKSPSAWPEPRSTNCPFAETVWYTELLIKWMPF